MDLQQKVTKKNKMTDLRANIKLSEADKEVINMLIIGQRNVVKACEFADIHYLTFRKAVNGDGLMLVRQRKRLLEFCDGVMVQSAVGSRQ